jgi:hypothetical protein
MFPHFGLHLFHVFSHLWNAFFTLFSKRIFKSFFFHICFTLFFTCLILIIVFKLVAGNGNDKDSQFFYELSMCFVGVAVYSIMLHVETCWNWMILFWILPPTWRLICWILLIQYEASIMNMASMSSRITATSAKQDSDMICFELQDEVSMMRGTGDDM